MANQGKPWSDEDTAKLLNLAADHAVELEEVANTLERSYPAVMKKLTKMVADMDYTTEMCDKYRVKYALVEKAARLRNKTDVTQKKPKPTLANILQLLLEIRDAVKQ